jgi:hypothetical protein
LVRSPLRKRDDKRILLKGILEKFGVYTGFIDANNILTS